MKDLYILTADLDTENCIKAVLPRFQADGVIHPITFDLNRHPNRDSGCFSKGPEFIRDTGIKGRYEHVLIIFDHEGCGQEKRKAVDVEHDVINRLVLNGWDRAKVDCIVIEPEIENWLWTQSLHTAKQMGWTDLATLTNWLKGKGYVFQTDGKPTRPKEAAEAATREKRIRFMEIHGGIASIASYTNCSSPSFLKYKDTLMTWFSNE